MNEKDQGDKSYELYQLKKNELVKDIDSIKELDPKRLNTKIQEALLRSNIEQKQELNVLAEGFKARNEYLLDTNSPDYQFSQKQKSIPLIKEILVPVILNGDKFDGTNGAENVKVILRCLKKLNYTTRDTFDSGTLTDLIRFQKRMNIKPDGLIGSETISCIISELGKKGISPKILQEVETTPLKKNEVFGLEKSDEHINLGVLYQTHPNFQIDLAIQKAVKELMPNSKIDIDGKTGKETQKNIEECLKKYNIKSSDPTDKNDEQYNYKNIIGLYEKNTSKKFNIFLDPNEYMNFKEQEKATKTTIGIGLKRAKMLNILLSEESLVSGIINKSLASDQKISEKDLTDIENSIEENLRKKNEKNISNININMKKIKLENKDIIIKTTNIIKNDVSLSQKEKKFLLATLLCENGLAGDASFTGELGSKALDIGYNMLDIGYNMLDIGYNDEPFSYDQEMRAKISFGPFQIQYKTAYEAIKFSEKNIKTITWEELKRRIENPEESIKLVKYIFEMKKSQLKKNLNLSK